jgi:hypothetical protein
MQTCVELPDRAALIAHCRKILSRWPTAPEVTAKTLQVQLYAITPDERIGWKETWIVIVPGYGVLGFTDGPANA